MDELEISGKRYISSRRAGKENKYHADYIGQLIRAKKVEGQKVGRAWDVDVESLAAYLGKEAPVRTPVTESVQVVNEVPEKVGMSIVVEEEVEIKEEEPEVIEQKETIKETISEIKIAEASAAPTGLHNEALPIFYRTTREAHEARVGRSTSMPTLRYSADEGPLIPQVQKQPQNNSISIRHVAAAPVVTKIHQPEGWGMPKRVEDKMENRAERPAHKETPVVSKRKSAPLVVRAAAVLALGATVFAVAALASTHLLFTVTVNGGQSANAGYSVK
ncbi:MAG TPA: hypothetical protein VIJ88_01380 [Candidatus Paceibacterota bacterium]